MSTKTGTATQQEEESSSSSTGFMPSVDTVAIQAGWYAEDPLGNVTDTGSVDDVMLQTYDRYAASNSGAFPNFFPQIVNRNKIWGELQKFTPEQIVRLKQRLWAAGYLVYRDEKGATNPFVAPPTSPSMDTAFIGAFNNFTHDAATQKDANGNAYTLDSLLNTAIQARSRDIREATIAEFDLTTQAENLQNWAEKNIGRNLSNEEIQTIFSRVQTTDATAFADARSESKPFGSSINDLAYATEPLMGGGPDSKSINYLKSLANVYGLAVTAAWQPPTNLNAPVSLLEGRGAFLAGNLENLSRLKEWAETQKGDVSQGGANVPLFEIVEYKYENGLDNDPTGLYLAINDYAVGPMMSGTSINYRSFNDDAARFLQAIKRPGGRAAYNWEGNGVQRGAYGLSDEIWNHYTQNVFKNIDTNDHSAAAQDAVARAYAQDLFNGDHNYQNWRQVAIAFLKNEQAATVEREGRNNEGDNFVNPFLSDEDRVRLSNIMADMGKPLSIASGLVGVDPYTMMYGTTGMSVPTVSDPYAGRPRSDTDYANRAMREARDIYGGKRLSAAGFNKIISILQDYDSSVLGGVE